jgi:hypothetical protein
MDKIKTAIGSPVFAGFVRTLIAYGCGYLSKHGLDLGTYELPIACTVVMALDMAWSKYSKRPRKIVIISKTQNKEIQK